MAEQVLVELQVVRLLQEEEVVLARVPMVPMVVTLELEELEERQEQGELVVQAEQVETEVQVELVIVVTEVVVRHPAAAAVEQTQSKIVVQELLVVMGVMD